MSSMRESMPVTAAFIDELRAAFGRAEIDGQIRAGMKGAGCFWASENGHTVGSISDEPGVAISGDDLWLSPVSAGDDAKKGRKKS